VDRIQALAIKVQERVSNFDGKVAVDPYKGKKGLSFFELSFRYATISDRIIFGITCIAIVVYGSAQPVFSVLFGSSSTNVSATAHGE
jgi:hypothetical protein